MPLHLEPGATSEQQITFNTALNYLRQNPEAAHMIDNSHFTVQLNNANVASVYRDPSGLTNPVIQWDPSSAMQVMNMGKIGVQSPAMGLIHEIAHAIFGADEPQATAIETRIAITLNEPTRFEYNATGNFVDVKNPTQHTNQNNEWVCVNAEGVETKSVQYDGSTTSPDMGWAGTSAGGGSGGGSLGTAAGGGTGDGMTPFAPSEPVGPGGSVEVVPMAVEMPSFELDLAGADNLVIVSPYDSDLDYLSYNAPATGPLVEIVGVADLY